MANVFIFHGVEGCPEENWFPWLKKELEELGRPVVVPPFPTPANQTLERWMEVFEKYESLITPETILIGHSLGAAFALSIIEKHPVQAAFLISGFVGKIGHPFDLSMETFTQKHFNWERIKSHCRTFGIFHSDNDPYVALNKAEELAERLESGIELVPGAGHFNSASGYDTFELLLDRIKRS